MINTKVIAAAQCLVAVSLCSCVRLPSNITPIEGVLGTGWQCHAAPDGLKKAGVVIEVTTDRKYIFDSDFSSESIDAQSAIGAAKYNSKTSLGGVLNLLQNLGVVGKDAKAAANLASEVNILVAYGGTRRHVISGPSADMISANFSSRGIAPGRHFIIYRESQSATSLDITIDKSAIASLDAAAELDANVGINSKLTKDGASNYRLKSTFAEPIGVCTLATTLVVARNFGGGVKVEFGETVNTPKDVRIGVNAPTRKE